GSVLLWRRKEREGEDRPPAQATLRGGQRLRDPRRLHDQVIEPALAGGLSTSTSGSARSVRQIMRSASRQAARRRAKAMLRRGSPAAALRRQCSRQTHVWPEFLVGETSGQRFWNRRWRTPTVKQ